MLISKDCTGKTGSIFECDRCKGEIHTPKEGRYRIAVQNTSESVKTVSSWDFCRRCYRILCRSIELTAEKMTKEKEEK